MKFVVEFIIVLARKTGRDVNLKSYYIFPVCVNVERKIYYYYEMQKYMCTLIFHRKFECYQQCHD
jgi:hypothetical protein